MCKYCKFTYVSNLEKTNNCRKVMSIRDGARLSEVFINRYQTDTESNNEIILDESIVLSEGAYTVKEKHIKITYCPFCGEKL
jgi:hypothetical protein